ncbi:MAG: iron-containing alcohol dehydrogenase [Pleomorphochaeta sp.]
MNSFNYYTPTKVIFKENGEKDIAKELQPFNPKKVLIHYGGQSAIKSGLIDRVKSYLEDANISYVLLGGVVANPLLSKVNEGIDLCKRKGVDFILAVGGGSVIDSSKAIAIGLFNGGNVWDFFEGKRKVKGSYRVASILTIAAAGSEMSSGCVITKDEGLLKRSCKHPDVACRFSIMNPLLTLTLPNYQTFSGIVDILMHTMERYLNTDGDQNLDITDEIAEGLMRAVIKNAKILKEDPQNVQARWNVMWASSLSHNGLTGCGTNSGEWAVHKIEHELGGMYNVAHGAGLSAVFSAWALYVFDKIEDRLEKFAIKVWNVEAKDSPKETALAGLEKLREFYRSIDMPTNLKELGINPSDKEIEELSIKATNFGGRLIGTTIGLDKDDLIKIYNMAK